MGSLTRAQRARADRRLAVGSALFGLVAAGDRIPAYRLSAGSALPGLPTLRALWKPALSPVLAAVDELVVDLRSGSYAALAPVPGAVTVDVLSERPDGTRAVVGHDGWLGLVDLASATRVKPIPTSVAAAGTARSTATGPTSSRRTTTTASAR